MVAVGQSSPTLNGVVFDSNWTTESWGGALSVQGYGGQVVRLNDVTFVDNDSPTTGGALHVSGSTTVIDGATFEGNWAHEGGAVHLATCRPCTLRDITFTDNTAAYGRGGGLLCEMSPDGVATMSDLTFLDNTAATGGGGMACHNATTTPISYATFAGNSASTGGGLDVSGSAVVLSSATFCQNEATSSGGGIYLDGASSIDLDASIVAYSTDGEGIAQWGSAPQVITCTDIYGNADGDWVGPFAAYQGVAGNFSEQPLFCELLNRIFTLHVDSPCLPHANDCGTLIGAHGVGCPSTGVSECGVSLVRAPTPNPFGRSTSISYELREPSVVSARVYDASGRLVRVLLNSEPVAPGTRVLTWDGERERGGAVASGVYFVKLELDGRTHTSRAVLIR